MFTVGNTYFLTLLFLPKPKKQLPLNERAPPISENKKGKQTRWNLTCWGISGT
jgi:hypothetical protein